MKILAVDASTAVASAGLAEDGRLVCELNLRHGLTHSQKLLPLVEAALTLADWTLDDVDALAVVSGPGSFTGLRIGAATVKGLAFTRNIPVVPVGTLEVLAFGLPGFSGLLVPLLDARRSEVYAALYRWRDGSLEEVVPPAAKPLEVFLGIIASFGEPVAFLGDGVEPNQGALAAFPGAFLVPESARLQRSGAAALLGYARYLEGKTVPSEAFTPEYMRDSSARPPVGLKIWDL